MYSDMGGWIVFVAFLIWSASAHFKVMLRSFRSGHISGEQWAFVGFVLSLLALSFMLKLIGVGLMVALGVVILQIVMAVALARMVAESGLMYVQPSFAANDLIYAAVGTSRLSSGTLTGITFMFAVGFRDLREDLLPRILNSFKIAGSGKGSLRYLVIAIIIALILGTAVTTFSHLRLMYLAGASGLEFWTFNIAPATPFQWLNSLLLNPTGTSWPAMGFVSIGSVAMLSLLLMRRAFLWWHVHPIGFIICRIWFIENIWFSIFIAWLAKSSILRLGGLKGYNKARPFFLGLVLGEIFVGGILVFVSCIVGHGYNFLGF